MDEFNELEVEDALKLEELIKNEEYTSFVYENTFSADPILVLGILHKASLLPTPNVLQFLLNLKYLDPNRINLRGETPFYFVCTSQKLPAIKCLLKDPRVDTHKPDTVGKTPLMVCVAQGFLPGIEVLIASGRELNLATTDKKNKNLIQYAKEMNQNEITSLLEIYQNNPAGCRKEMRIKHGFSGLKK